MTVMRITALLLCIAAVLLLCGCGDVSGVHITDVPSELYTQEDINAAIRVIMRDFFQDWDNCSLREIRYAGDEILLEPYEDGSNELQYWTGLYNADEAIILMSDFYVSPAAEYDPENTLAADTLYTDWNWILVRDHGGAWRHMDHGYG